MGSVRRAKRKMSVNNSFERLRRDFARGWYENSGAYGSISATKSIKLPKSRTRRFKKNN